MSKRKLDFTLQIDAEVQDLIRKADQIKKSMQGIVDSGKAPEVEKAFANITKAIDRLQQKSSTPINTLSAFDSLLKDSADITGQLGKLGQAIQRLYNLPDADKINLLPPNLKQSIHDAENAIISFSNAFIAAQTKASSLIDAEKDLIKAEEALKKAESNAQEKSRLVAIQQQQVQAEQDQKKAIEAKLAALKEYQETLAAYERSGADKRSAFTDSSGKTYNLRQARAKAKATGLDVSTPENLTAGIQQTQGELKKQSAAVTDATQILRKYAQALTDANNRVALAQSAHKNLAAQVSQAQQAFQVQSVQDTNKAFADLRNEAQRLGVDLTNIPVDYTDQAFQDLTMELVKLKQKGLDQVNDTLQISQKEMGDTADSANNLNGALKQNQKTAEELDERMAAEQAFNNRIKQFVGIQGAALVMRKALQEAFETIKQLDATMTEMAVVTDLNVGDYWDQLPEYAARATELGVSINSAYQAATLYYQQGLKSNEVTAMSAETLKMARIAGLSAEDATNKMTAA